MTILITYLSDFITFSAKSRDSDLSDSQDSNSLSTGLYSSFGKFNSQRSLSADGPEDVPVLPLHSPDDGWQAMQTILNENMVAGHEPRASEQTLVNNSLSNSLSGSNKCPFAAAFEGLHSKQSSEGSFATQIQQLHDSDTESRLETSEDCASHEKSKSLDIPLLKAVDSSIAPNNGLLNVNHQHESLIIPDISIQKVDSDPLFVRAQPEILLASDVNLSFRTTSMLRSNEHTLSSGLQTVEEGVSDSNRSLNQDSLCQATSSSKSGEKKSFSGTGDVGNLVMSTLSQLDKICSQDPKHSNKKSTKDVNLSSLMCLPDFFRRIHQSKKTKNTDHDHEESLTDSPTPRTNSVNDKTGTSPFQFSWDSSPKRKNSLKDFETATVLIHNDGLSDTDTDKGAPTPNTNSHNHKPSSPHTLELNQCSSRSPTASDSHMGVARKELPSPRVIQSPPHRAVSGSPTVPSSRYRAFRSNSIAVQAFPCLSPARDDSSGRMVRCGSASAHLESMQVDSDTSIEH